MASRAEDARPAELHAVRRNRLRQHADQVWFLHRQNSHLRLILRRCKNGMCGIAGFHSPTFPDTLYERTIVDMLSRIQHRGPDESGYFFDEHVAIGSVRLSVIDLHTGSQPMSDQSGRYWIVYNGEIYNYKHLRQSLKQLGYSFRTESDTE